MAASAETVILSPGSGLPGTSASLLLVDFAPCLSMPFPGFCGSFNVVNVYFGSISTPVGQSSAPAGFMFFPNPVPFLVPTVPAGTYAVTAVDAAGHTATASFVVLAPGKTDQTITFASLEGRTYGDPDIPLTATASSGLPVSFAATGSCSIVSGPSVHILGTGQCAITASQAGNDTYNAAADVRQEFNVVRRSASVTPNAASKIYGDSDPELGGTLAGFLASDGVTASYSRAPGENVGTYQITATLLSPESVLVNYEIAYNTATFTISITPTSLCVLTTQYVQGSTKYVALPPRLQVQAEQLATAACDKLALLPGATSPDAAAIATYKHLVEVLRLTDYLTADQAVFLKNGADQL
jgi:hypothetical protein